MKYPFTFKMGGFVSYPLAFHLQHVNVYPLYFFGLDALDVVKYTIKNVELKTEEKVVISKAILAEAGVSTLGDIKHLNLDIKKLNIKTIASKVYDALYQIESTNHKVVGDDLEAIKLQYKDSQLQESIKLRTHKFICELLTESYVRRLGFMVNTITHGGFIKSKSLHGFESILNSCGFSLNKYIETQNDIKSKSASYLSLKLVYDVSKFKYNNNLSKVDLEEVLLSGNIKSIVSENLINKIFNRKSMDTINLDFNLLKRVKVKTISSTVKLRYKSTNVVSKVRKHKFKNIGVLTELLLFYRPLVETVSSDLLPRSNNQVSTQNSPSLNKLIEHYTENIVNEISSPNNITDINAPNDDIIKKTIRTKTVDNGFIDILIRQSLKNNVEPPKTNVFRRRAVGGVVVKRLNSNRRTFKYVSSDNNTDTKKRKLKGSETTSVSITDTARKYINTNVHTGKKTFKLSSLTTKVSRTRHGYVNARVLASVVKRKGLIPTRRGFKKGKTKSLRFSKRWRFKTGGIARDKIWLNSIKGHWLVDDDLVVEAKISLKAMLDFVLFFEQVINVNRFFYAASRAITAIDDVMKVFEEWLSESRPEEDIPQEYFYLFRWFKWWMDGERGKNLNNTDLNGINVLYKVRDNMVKYFEQRWGVRDVEYGKDDMYIYSIDKSYINKLRGKKHGILGQLVDRDTMKIEYGVGESDLDFEIETETYKPKKRDYTSSEPPYIKD